MDEFSVRRVVRLVRDRLAQDLIPIGIAALVMLGVLLLIWTASGNWGMPIGRGDPENTLWVPLVVLGCFVVSSQGFRAMQSPRSVTDWLLLPATSTEKYLAVLIETQVIVPAVASLAGLVLWVISGDFGIPRQFGEFEPWAVFVVANLWFMAGSTVFRRGAFLKTALVSIGFLLVMVVIPNVLTDRFWHHRFVGPGPEAGGLVNALWYVGAFVLTPVAALAFSYFRVKEKEARDAVQ